MRTQSLQYCRCETKPAIASRTSSERAPRETERVALEDFDGILERERHLALLGLHRLDQERRAALRPEVGEQVDLHLRDNHRMQSRHSAKALMHQLLYYYY